MMYEEYKLSLKKILELWMRAIECEGIECHKCEIEKHCTIVSNLLYDLEDTNVNR